MLVRTACLLLLPVLTYQAKGQDWALFPLDQRSYYADSINPEKSVVYMRLFDSTRTAIEGQVTYSRRKLEIGGVDGCSGYVVDPWFQPHEDFAMDSLLERNDTVFYWYDVITSPFYFLPRAQVGQSWTIISTSPDNDYSDITVTCAGVALETFCGVTDSVKTFDLDGSGPIPWIDQFKMRLSKSHGLIQYIPFGQFVYHPSWQPYLFLRMIGFETGGIAHGFKPPVFDDFFHPLVGDIMLWKERFYSGYPWAEDYVRYHRDSITLVVNAPDSIVAYFDRTTQNEDNTIVDLSGQVAVFERQELSPLAECPPHWYAQGQTTLGPPYNPFSDPLWYSYVLEIRYTGGSSDTVVALGLGSELWDLDMVNCSIGGAASDIGYGAALDTRAGFTGHSMWLNPNEYYFDLIGSLINGDLQGNIELSVPSVPDIGGTISLYPNPAREQLFLKAPELHGRMDYAVYNTSGVVVLNGQLTALTVFVGDLRPGLYSLQLKAEGRSFTARFVRE